MRLYNELNDLDKAPATDPQCIVSQGKRRHVKLQQEWLERHTARAAQVCARANRVEKGEENTEFFLNLEKSRANAKIMDCTKKCQWTIRL